MSDIDKRTVFRMNNKEWTVDINGLTLSRARAGGVSLADLFTGGIPDMGTMLELTWFGVQHMSEFSKGKNAIRKDDFLAGLKGQTLADALAATSAAIELCFKTDDAEGETDGDPLA